MTMLEGQVKAFTIEASALGELLHLPPSDVQVLMHKNEITCLCEQGEAEHLGLYRLTFFYEGCRARFIIDEAGRILRRSTITLRDSTARRGETMK